MTIEPQIPTSPPGEPAFGSAERAAARGLRRSAMLDELAEIGMDLARAVRRQAMAQAAQAEAAVAKVEADRVEAGELVADVAPPGRIALPGRGAADLGLVFERIARAVRRTLALDARFEEEFRTRQERAAAAETAAQAETTSRETQAAAEGWRRKRAKIGRHLGQLIEANEDLADDVERREALLGDLYERLDEIDPEDEIADLPIGAVIQRIARSLRLRPDWIAWEDEDWAIEEAESDHPDSPYAAWRSDWGAGPDPEFEDPESEDPESPGPAMAQPEPAAPEPPS